MYHSSYINETDFLNMSMTNGVGRSYKCVQLFLLLDFCF
eukprot:COSAG05_NODE_752_length_7532_cov_44.503565_4_plen_39_part_00